MAVAILKVSVPQWNTVEIAASIFGLDMAPDTPEGVVTAVEICGSPEKLQQMMNHIDKRYVDREGPLLITVVDQLPLPADQIR